VLLGTLYKAEGRSEEEENFFRFVKGKSFKMLNTMYRFRSVTTEVQYHKILPMGDSTAKHVICLNNTQKVI
jgi:hypothetical protein